jgi:hypothetical protein
MKMKHVLVLGLLVLGAGCSDDTTPVDSGPKPDVAVPDLGLDAPLPDLALEAGADLAADLPADTATGDVGDAMLPDKGPPDMFSDMGTPNLTGTITRTVEPILDAKGDVWIGISFLPPPIQSNTTIIKGVSLPSKSSSHAYGISVPVGTYWLFAFLDDNSNAAFPFAVPDVVDLATSKATQIKVVAGQPLQVDLVLDALGGYVATDAGVPSITGLKGTVKASVAPALDGKGMLRASLHSQPPPAGQVAQSGLNNADLSSPFTQEMFFLGNLTAGNYYLRVYLDDNGNNKLDTDDLTHSSPIQVHVVSGTIASYNVVLDKVQQ